MVLFLRRRGSKVGVYAITPELIRLLWGDTYQIVNGVQHKAGEDWDGRVGTYHRGVITVIQLLQQRPLQFR